MLNLGTPELLVILLVALIVLGPSKLPEAARKLAHAMSEFRRMSSGFQTELRDALDSIDVISTDEADRAAGGNHEEIKPKPDDYSSN